MKLIGCGSEWTNKTPLSGKLLCGRGEAHAKTKQYAVEHMAGRGEAHTKTEQYAVENMAGRDKSAVRRTEARETEKGVLQVEILE